MNKILGLDISSAAVGWCILGHKNKQLTLLDYGYITPLSNDVCVEKRVLSAVEEIVKIYNKHKPDEVVIEEISKSFTKGKSNADTIMLLAGFNKIISYELYKLSHLPPHKLMPATIRKIIREHLGLKNRLNKDDIYDIIKKQFKEFKPILIERNGPYKGNERKENKDITDSVATAWSFLIKNPP